MPRPTAHRLAAAALSGIVGAALVASVLAVLHLQAVSGAGAIGVAWGLVPVLAGALLALVAWMIVADTDAGTEAGEPMDPMATVCPECGGPVQSTWRLCPHCGGSLRG